MWKAASTVFDRALSFLGAASSWVLAIIVVFITIEISVRLTLGRGLPWPLEFSTYCLLWSTFLGAAWLLRDDKHVKMDMVLGRLKPKLQTQIQAITSIASALVFLVVTFYSTRIVIYLFATRYYIPSAMETPKGIVMSIIPVGAFLLFIQCVRRSHRYLQGWRGMQQ